MPKTQRRGYRKCASEQREVSSGAQEVPQVSHFSAAWRSSRSQKADTVVHRYAHSALDAEPEAPNKTTAKFNYHASDELRTAMREFLALF